MKEDPKTWREKWYEARERRLMIKWKLWRLEHPVKVQHEVSSKG